MTDVTIPAEDAVHIAVILRGAESGRPVADPVVMRRLANLLDPPLSLRDEVAREMEPLLLHDTAEDARQAVEDILAVVRRHVESLPTFGSPDGWPEPLGLNRDDVLRLLGATDE